GKWTFFTRRTPAGRRKSVPVSGRSKGSDNGPSFERAVDADEVTGSEATPSIESAVDWGEVAGSEATPSFESAVDWGEVAWAEDTPSMGSGVGAGEITRILPASAGIRALSCSAAAWW